MHPTSKRTHAPPRTANSDVLLGIRGRHTGWVPREEIDIDEDGMENVDQFFASDSETPETPSSPPPVYSAESPSSDEEDMEIPFSIVSPSPPTVRSFSGTPPPLCLTREEQRRIQTRGTFRQRL